MNNETDNGKLAYTVKEFCGAVGIGASKFYALVSEGKIKPKKCGKKTLITADEAHRFVSSLEAA